MIQRRYRIFLGIFTSQVAWLAALLVAPGPWQAAALFAALLGGGAVLLFPHVGILLLSALLIGQWPWNAISYLGMLTIISSLAFLLINQLQLFPRNLVLTFTGLYFLIALMSVISPQTSNNIRSEVLTLAGHCSFVWLFATMVNSRRMLLLIVQSMVFSGVITGLIGLVQWRTHFVWIASATYHALQFNEQALRQKTAFDLQQWRGQFRIDSITGTPDYLPLLMQCLMPFVAFWLVRQRRWSLRLMALAILGLFAVVHLLSFTRGALLTTAIVVILWAWIVDRKRFVFYGPLLTLIAVGAMLSWSPLRERILSIINLTSAESPDSPHTGTWRLRTVPVAIQMISEHPFLGVGLGQQRWNWPESAIGDLIPDPQFAEPPLIHNDYLRVAIDLGVGGACLLLILLATTVRALQRLSRHFFNCGDLVLCDLSRGTMLALIGLALAMPIYPLINDFRYFWLLLGVTASLLRIEKETGTAPPQIPQ